MDLNLLEKYDSAHLCLARPTPEEQKTIWTHTAADWRDSLSLSAYFEESQYLTTVPLARNGGMTTWILVDGRLPPGNRPILSSCETFRKRALTSDQYGNVTDTIIHGIASVFCFPEYRGRRYPKRLMEELAKSLPTWQTDELRCIGSILYSDIGKDYYAKLGWQPNKTNNYIEFKASKTLGTSPVAKVVEADLPNLCARDEAQLRNIMAMPAEGVDTRVTIIPDLDHIGWHLAKEEFACKQLFGNVPENKGAIAGTPGNQVWAIWTHRYYKHPDLETTDNVLYILRLVVEADETANRLPSHADKLPDHKVYEEQKRNLEAVLKAAQNEALEWKLDTVQLWDPTLLVQRMLKEIDIAYDAGEREDEKLASGMWYDESGGISKAPPPLWLNNEHYAWC